MNVTTLKKLHNKNALGWLLVNVGLFFAGLLALLLQVVGAAAERYNARPKQRRSNDNLDWRFDPSYSQTPGNVYFERDD